MSKLLDSSMFEFENFLLTFFQYLPSLPSLGGRGERGGGTRGSLFCPPPPLPSPIEKGEGNRWGNFKYIWLEIRDLFSRSVRGHFGQGAVLSRLRRVRRTCLRWSTFGFSTIFSPHSSWI